MILPSSFEKKFPCKFPKKTAHNTRTRKHDLDITNQINIPTAQVGETKFIWESYLTSAKLKTNIIVISISKIRIHSQGV